MKKTKKAPNWFTRHMPYGVLSTPGDAVQTPFPIFVNAGAVKRYADVFAQ